MRYLPVMLDLKDCPVLVVGAGAVAARKAALLVRGGARVTVVAPEIGAEMERLASREDRLRIARRRFGASDLGGVRLVFAATNDAKVQSDIAAEAEKKGVWVNAADEPENCTFLMPALLERGPLQVAVSTGGASPALARRVRDEIDAALGPEFVEAAEVLGELRERFERGEARGRAFTRLLDEGLLEALRQGDEARVERMTREALQGLPRARTRAARDE
jgi:siroheme synthase-like protein